MKLRSIIIAMAGIFSLGAAHGQTRDLLEGVAGTTIIRDQNGQTNDIRYNNGKIAVVQPLSSAAYASYKVGSTIYSKGYLYTATFPIVGTVASNSTITTIYYSYGFSYYPAGLVVYLCHENTSKCIDVSTIRSTGTNAFSGLSAKLPMLLAYGVVGSGSILPVYSNNNSVIVNFNF